MTPGQHYVRAEALLREGAKVVGKLNEAAASRDRLRSDARLRANVVDAREESALTARMDELGKKAMGIWAQAGVHATLATVRKSVADDAQWEGV